MTPQEKFDEIKDSIPGVEMKKMFGAQGLRMPGHKVMASLHKENLTIKLPTDKREEVMTWEEVQLFEPMPGKPMANWIQIPFRYADNWKDLILIALENSEKK